MWRDYERIGERHNEAAAPLEVHTLSTSSGQAQIDREEVAPEVPRETQEESTPRRRGRPRKTTT